MKDPRTGESLSKSQRDIRELQTMLAFDLKVIACLVAKLQGEVTIDLDEQHPEVEVDLGENHTGGKITLRFKKAAVQ